MNKIHAYLSFGSNERVTRRIRTHIARVSQYQRDDETRAHCRRANLPPPFFPTVSRPDEAAVEMTTNIWKLANRSRDGRYGEGDSYDGVCVNDRVR